MLNYWNVFIGEPQYSLLETCYCEVLAPSAVTVSLDHCLNKFTEAKAEQKTLKTKINQLGDSEREPVR